MSVDDLVDLYTFGNLRDDLATDFLIFMPSTCQF